MSDNAPPLSSKKRAVAPAPATGRPGVQPIHAWTIVASGDNEPYKKDPSDVTTVDLKQKQKYEDDMMQVTKQGFINDVEFDTTKQGKQVLWNKRMMFFYISFIIYGIDITNTITSGSKRWLLFTWKIFILFLIFVLCVFHWMEIVCALKEDYLQYGSSLVNLVFTARLTATIISHTIVHNRRKVIAKLMADMDEIGDNVNFTFISKRNICVNLFWGLFSIFMYCVFPVKYYYDYDFVNPILNSNSTPPAFFIVHEFSLAFLDHWYVNLLTFFILYYDSIALTFFVAFASRFYIVFRSAPFCRWLENGDRHEIGTVMKKFRSHHYIICNFVEQVDVAFAPTVLIWYVYLTMSLCCWIRAISSSAFETFNGAAIVIFSLIESLVEFYFLSVSTSLVNDEVTAHLDSIRLMCLNEDLHFSTSMTQIQDRINHLSYITCVLASPVSLTGWGFFSVSRGFVLTVSSTVLTFTLVLYGV